LSLNLGTLTSWNPLGHSRPVTGLLYFYIVETVSTPSDITKIETNISGDDLVLTSPTMGFVQALVSTAE